MLIAFLHVAGRFAASLLKLPYYASRNAGFLYQQWRGIVADVINLDKEYQSAVARVEWAELPRFLGGADPEVKLRLGAAYGNVNLLESLALAYFVKSLQPRRVFEFGTFDGFSTYHLAMNAPEDAEIFTLNLPAGDAAPSGAAGSDACGDTKTHLELKRRGVGSVVRDSPAAGRVTQLFGDSLRYDFSPYRGNMDLVFIDGGHSWECVAKDTESALAMLSPRGVMLWHDFNVQHRDVYRFLLRFARSRKSYWLADTRLAFSGPGLR